MIVNFDKFKNKKILVTQIGSFIGSDKRQRGSLKGLGLRGINSSSELKCTNDIVGMLKKVSHLIKVEESKK